MKKIAILAVGRIKERALAALCSDYYRRARILCEVVEREVRDMEALCRALRPRDFVVALDEGGQLMNSREFATQLGGWLSLPELTRSVFAIGGPDGQNAAIRRRADATISLSPLTYSHRLARLVLAEQLYRAASILRNAPYHRG